MTLFSLDRRVGQGRVPFETQVRLMPNGQNESVLGSTINLSEAGMFVRVEQPLSVDSELNCDLFLPEPHPRVPLRGRVAWVQGQPIPGMGIEFIDLTEPDRSRLRTVVSSLETDQVVKVWLETLTHPIRAKVCQSQTGVVLRAPLPFLRLLSSAVVYPLDAPDAAYSGTLDAVTLQPGEGPVPELRLHLSLRSVEATAEQAAQQAAQRPREPEALLEPSSPPRRREASIRRRRPSRPTLKLTAVPGPEAHAPEAHAPEASRPSLAQQLAQLPDTTPPPDRDQAAGEIVARKKPTLEIVTEPAVETELDQPAEEAEQPQLAPQQQQAETAQPPTAEQAAPAQQRASAPAASQHDEDTAATDQLLQLEQDEPFSPPTSLPATEPEQGWSMPAPDPSAQSHWSLSSEDVEQELARHRRRGSLWLWGAACAMVAVTVGSMVYTDAWSRAWHWVQGRSASAAPATAAAVPAGVGPHIVRLDPAPASSKPAASSEQPASTKPASSEQPASTEQPTSTGQPASTEQTAAPGPAAKPSPAATAGPDSGDDTAEPRATATPDEPAEPDEPTEPDEPAAPPVAGERPHVVDGPDGRTLVVPLSGAVRGAESYELAQPDGLVVNLPQAKPRAGFGDYAVGQGPFRLVWLHRRQEGVHLRVLFKGKRPDYRLKIQQGAVRVVLAPAH